MVVEVFDSLEKLSARFKETPFFARESPRKRALAHYFSRRGIVQLELDAESKDWPRLVYPTPEKLEEQITSLERKHRDQSSKKKEWQATHFKASSKEVMAHAKKLTDPLFWKHVAKSATDSNYRADARTIDLHSSLISDAKYRPMIEAFVENPEYRKQLTETVKTSPVYKNHKGLAKHADDRRQLQLEVSKSMLEQSDEQLKDYHAQLSALRELLKWSEGK